VEVNPVGKRKARMDPLEEVLSSLIEGVPGASMAALLGVDGVAVQVALGEAWQGVDQAVLEVELASLAESVQKAARGLGAAASEAFFLGTVQASYLGTMLDTSYFLVLGLGPAGDLARARSLLEQARATLGPQG